MVSFFGLKLGSDKRKTHNKLVKSRKGEPGHHDPANEVQFYGPYYGQQYAQDSNSSQLQFPASTRPGTAHSARSTSTRRPLFKDPSMATSMVDLSLPRRQPDDGSLRHAASDLNLWRPGFPFPVSPGASERQRQTSSKPTPASNSGMESPLSTNNFSKALSAARPQTPLEPAIPHTGNATPPKSPKPSFGRLDSDLKTYAQVSTSIAEPSQNYPKPTERTVTQNGCPSPPQSEISEGSSSFTPNPSPVKHKLNRHHNIPTTPTKAGFSGPKSLPSPAPSIQRSSEDRTDSPIIRNVPGRRETFAFHQPRNRSKTMEFEEGHRCTMMHPPKEGFSGNFADFDFGDITSKTATKTDSRNSEAGSQTAMKFTPPDKNIDSKAHPEIVSSCSGSIRSTSSSRSASICGEGNYAESLLSNGSSEDLISSSALIDQLPQPPRVVTISRLQGPFAADVGSRELDSALKIIPQQGFQSRFDDKNNTRAPPPRPLRPNVSWINGVKTPPQSPFGPPLKSNGTNGTDQAPPAQTHDMPPSSPFSQRPMEGNFPVTKGLPRGRQPGPQPWHLTPTGSENESDLSLPSWADMDGSNPRRSAMPAPLSPLRTNNATNSTAVTSPTPGLTAAPRIPTQTFSSLIQSFSFVETFGEQFEIGSDDENSNSPILGHLSNNQAQFETSPVRVETTKAPPRPPPVTLPPSFRREVFGAACGQATQPLVAMEVSSNFI